MEVTVKVGDIIIPLSHREADALRFAIEDRLLPDMYEHRVEDEPENVYDYTRQIETWEFIARALKMYGDAATYHREYIKG